MKKFFVLIIPIFMLFVSGCTRRIGSATILSTKNIDFAKFASFKKTKERVTGKDAARLICLIPIKADANLKEAIDKAIEKVPGGIALYDVVMYQTNIFALIYIENSYSIEGTVITDPAYVSNHLNSTGHIISYYDSKAKEQVTLPVSEKDYNELKSALKNEDGDAASNVLKRIASL